MILKPNENKTAMLDTSQKGLVYYVSPYFRAESIIKKIPDKCESEEIEIFFTNGKVSGTFRISLDNLTDTKTFLSECVKNYFIFLPAYVSLVHSELIEQMSHLINHKIFKYENKSIGWYTFEDNQVFLMDTKAMPNGSVCNCIRDMGGWQKGDELTYNKMLEDYVYNNPKMTLAYILGFSGVLVARISQNRDLGVILAGISGESTTGKSTAIKLIASIWANPDSTYGRIIMRADASALGFTAQFAGFNGIPIIFDDVDQNTGIHLGDQLNRFSQGTQRVVSDINGDAKFNRMGFSGICIFASECPLLDKTRKEVGLYPRFIDLQDIVWTVDAPSAEDIKNICSQNYGFKGKIFAEFLETKTTDELLKIFDDSYKFVDGKIENRDRFTSRAIKKYASIIATAYLMQDCFQIKIDMDEITKYLIVNENKNREDRNKAELTYDYIKEYFIENNSLFNLITEDNQKASKSYNFKSGCGIAVYKDKKLHLYIKTTTVDEILTKAGYNQLANYKKTWREKGWTQCETNRYDSSKSSLMPCRHFHFIYPDYDGLVLNYISVFKYAENQSGYVKSANNKVVDYFTEAPRDNFEIDDSEAIDEVFKDDETDEDKKIEKIFEENTKENKDDSRLYS